MKPFLIILASILIGGALGYANYRFIGCKTGTCPLSANPYISTIYGMVIGGLVGGMFR